MSTGLFDQGPFELDAESLIPRFQRLRTAESSRNLRQERSRTSCTPNSYLCIGIDFGTTFSGVAWAWSREPRNIHIVTDWNIVDGSQLYVKDDSKVPTAICYGPKGITWGYGIPAEENAIKWFKLLLLRENDLEDDVRKSKFLKTARSHIERIGKDPVDVVADFLRLLWQKTLTSMERVCSKSGVEGLPFKVVLTVPAIWKPYARVKMQDAAKRAGILESRLCGKTTLQLVSEPEAAALATLHEWPGRGTIKEDDIIVICDAGGGTADVISYKVTSLDPYKLHECVEGKGKLCGAIFTDEKFLATISKRLESKWDKVSPSSIQKIMYQDWEHGIKRGFDGTKDQEWNVSVPYEASVKRMSSLIPNARSAEQRREMPIVDGSIVLKTGHVKGIFSQSVSGVQGLINNQIASIYRQEGRRPKFAILVGGFGANSYLYNLLKEEHGIDGIDIVQSSHDRAWTAICRGAVTVAVSRPMITSRVSRLNYGTSYSTPFIEGVHEEEDRYRDDLECCDKAGNQMEWYVVKGQNLDVMKPVKFTYYYNFRSPQAFSRNGPSFRIFQSEEVEAQKRLDDTVHRMCSITLDLRDIEWDELPKVTNRKNVTYRRLFYEVEMLTRDATLHFEITANGKRLGNDSFSPNFE